MDAPSRGSCTQKIPRTLANGELTMYLIYAIAAAWTAFDAVICPVSGEPLRCNEDGTAESELPQRGQDHEK